MPPEPTRFRVPLREVKKSKFGKKGLAMFLEMVWIFQKHIICWGLSWEKCFKNSDPPPHFGVWPCNPGQPVYEVYCILGTGTLCHESVAPRPRKLSHIWKLVFWRCFIDKFKISMKKCLLWFLKLSSKISIKWCPVISLRVRHMFTNKKIRKQIYFFLLFEN